MSRASLLMEGLIQQSYSSSELPPLWEVIYQEAVRGHHLLFSRSDVERFETESKVHQLKDEDLENLEDLVVKLIECSDLSIMSRMIDDLPLSKRRVLYQLYQHALWVWKHYSKAKLN